MMVYGASADRESPEGSYCPPRGWWKTLAFRRSLGFRSPRGKPLPLPNVHQWERAGVRVREAPPGCDPSPAPQQSGCGATSPARGEVRESNSFDAQGIHRLQAGGISICKRGAGHLEGLAMPPPPVPWNRGLGATKTGGPASGKGPPSSGAPATQSSTRGNGGATQSKGGSGAEPGVTRVHCPGSKWTITPFAVTSNPPSMHEIKAVPVESIHF